MIDFSDPRPSSDRMERDGSSINPTEAALMARGVESHLAARLRAEGWTLRKLNQASEKRLRALGLPELAISILRGGARPEIPFKNLAEVLFANRFVCCVCRESERGVIVHHIREWSESHSHETANLATLCTEHHDRAHTVSKLTRNLDAKTIRQFKRDWEQEVRSLDASEILEASRDRSDAWLYFNHLRLFQLARIQGVKFTSLEHFRTAMAAGVIDQKGQLKPRRPSLKYKYSGGDGLPMYFYVRDVLHAVLERLNVINISNNLDRSVLSSILKPGVFSIVQGLHSFKRGDLDKSGPGQPVTGRRTANKVCVQYSFDLWEGTSVSAISTWLRGQKDVTSLVRVGSVSHDDGKLVVDCTVLSIAQGFYNFRTREYANAPFRPGYERLDRRR